MSVNTVSVEKEKERRVSSLLQRGPKYHLWLFISQSGRDSSPSCSGVFFLHLFIYFLL